MDCQVEKLEHFRLIILFEFSRGAKAGEAARNICAMHGKNAFGESTARNLFSRFKEDRFDMSDTQCSGRLSGFDEDRLNTLIQNDRCMANVMNCDHSTIVRHLYTLGKVKKSGVWLPNALSQNHKNQRVAVCASLFARHRLAREHHLPFVSCIVTGG